MTDHGSVMEKLKEWIDEKRLNHSLGVSRCAVELAGYYGADVGKAELAGMLHDCAKGLSFERSLELAKEFGIEFDMIFKMNPALLHAPLGSYLARDVFGIQDVEILEAIACHTTGKKDMTLLEKVLCLADYIEEGRNFPGVEKIRELAFVDINRALLTGLEMSIQAVLKSGMLLHPMTVGARNALLLEIQNTD